MTRTDCPRRHLAVMTILTLALGLALGTLTLGADEPEGETAELRGEAVPSPLRERLREALRLLEEKREGSMRLVPSETGEFRIIELDRPGSAICLAQPGGAGADPCRVGEAISRMPPCLEPGDCPAYEAWTRLYGMPRPLPADPDHPEERE